MSPNPSVKPTRIFLVLIPVTILVTILVIQISFALADPPIGSVMGNNSITASGLEGYYNASAAKTGQFIFHFGSYQQPANISADIEIVGLSPTIDNISCTTPNMSLIIAYGNRQGHLSSLHSDFYYQFYCDYGWFSHMTSETASLCDFDGDDCAEYERQSNVSYALTVAFTFRNITATAPFSTSIQIPATVMDEMKTSSGDELLNVSVAGNVVFTYVIDDRTFGFGDCSDNFSTSSQSIPISINRSFVIGGENKLIFIRSPVLREQWFRDNRFDAVLFSQCPIYFGSLAISDPSNPYQNQTIPVNFTLRNFSVWEDQYGIQQISSNQTNQSGWVEYAFNAINATSDSNNTNNTVNNTINSTNNPAITRTTPFVLEENNNSFHYIYEFNYSYAGLGTRNISFVIRDFALDSEYYNSSIDSRMVSYENSFTENGVPILSPSTSRPSVQFGTDSLLNFNVGLGLVAAVIILAFVNFWITR